MTLPEPNLRQRLEAIRRQRNLQWVALELDYALSWVLVGLAQSEPLRETLIFKGGTCLKKCYFGAAYRFSKDLDFTAVGAPRGADLESALHSACRKMREAFQEQIAPMDYALVRREEREPHPRGQECFAVRIRLPWHRPQNPASWTKVKLEINPTEHLSWPVARRSLIHGYGEALETTTLSTYSIEEIAAEKLRGILQFADALERRTWARSRARDYYDLWNILKAYPQVLAGPGFIAHLRRKCAAQGVEFSNPEAFFQASLLHAVRTTWSTFLGELVAELPDCEVVLQELQVALQTLAEDRE